MPEKRMTSMRFSVKVALRSPPKSSKRLQKSLSAQTAQAVHPHQTANLKHRCNGRPPLGFQSHRTSDSQGKGIGVSDGLPNNPSAPSSHKRLTGAIFHEW